MDDNLRRRGTVITLIYLGAWLLFALLKWSSFAKLDPNTVGDTLSGAFAPVAFLWLVLGFLQSSRSLNLQAKELKASVDALNLQAEELRRSVEQQEALVQVAREELQANIAALEFERNRAEKAEAESARLSMPKFSLDGGGYGTSTQGRWVNATLYNIGAECTSVVIRLVNADHIFLPEHRRQLLERGSGVALQFQCSGATEGTGTLQITFTSLRGEQVEQVYLVRVGTAGQVAMSAAD